MKTETEELEAFSVKVHERKILNPDTMRKISQGGLLLENIMNNQPVNVEFFRTINYDKKTKNVARYKRLVREKRIKRVDQQRLIGSDDIFNVNVLEAINVHQRDDSGDNVEEDDAHDEFPNHLRHVCIL